MSDDGKRALRFAEEASQQNRGAVRRLTTKVEKLQQELAKLVERIEALETAPAPRKGAK